MMAITHAAIALLTVSYFLLGDIKIAIANPNHNSRVSFNDESAILGFL